MTASKGKEETVNYGKKLQKNKNRHGCQQQNG